MTNKSLRERFGRGEEKSALVSQVIAAAIEEELVKPDETAPHHPLEGGVLVARPNPVRTGHRIELTVSVNNRNSPIMRGCEIRSR